MLFIHRLTLTLCKYTINMHTYSQPHTNFWHLYHSDHQMFDKYQVFYTETFHKRKSRHTHLGYVCSAAALYSVVGTTNVDTAHYSVRRGNDVLPAGLEQEYYMKPRKTQTCQHLPQQTHKLAQVINYPIYSRISRPPKKWVHVWSKIVDPCISRRRFLGTCTGKFTLYT